MTRTLVLTSLALMATGVLAQEPAQDPNPPIQDILNNVKKRAADQRLEDQRRALLLLQRADNSRQAGRVAEALEFARKAQVLFAESADIRLAVSNLLAEQRHARETSANMALARDRLAEALTRAETLQKDHRAGDAVELAEAVLQAADLFPAGFDVLPQRESADKLLAALRNQGAARDGSEVIPVPPRLIRELSPSEMKAILARRVTVEWHDEPLAIVFPLIVQETGIRVVVDPYLEKLGVFDVPRTGLRISNAPIERLLRMVTDMTGSAYIVLDGEIYVTTKANALANAIARSPERVELFPPGRINDPRRRPTNPEMVPGAPLPAPAAERTAEYLISGRALLENVEQLLKPIAEKNVVPDGK